MKHLALKLAGLALLAATPVAPAIAQPAPAITVGMKVVDVANKEVGLISARNDTTVTLRTDRYEIPLPSSSFALRDGKLYFAMTREQVNAEYAKALAAAEASLVVGAPVKGLGGTPVGTIASIDDQKVTIKLTAGQLVELPRSGIAGGQDGAVIGITAADLAKQVSSN